MNESNLTADERRAVNKTLRMFDVFRSVDPTMPIGTIASFLHVASNEGLAVRDLEALGFSKASASNHARHLGEGVARAGRQGLGLVAHNLDPKDVRIKRLSLTPKGELLAAQIANVVRR